MNRPPITTSMPVPIPAHPARRVAFLGLGAMGRRMAARLHEAGHDVIAWNRSPVSDPSMDARGIRRAATPREAVAEADVAISMVYDDAASHAVWLDPRDGALEALAPDAVAVESSTLSSEGLSELIRVFEARGRRLVDAPVAGSRPQADAGQLIFMAGGDAVDVERVHPLLLAMGHAVHHVGPAGSGGRLKLAVNALFGVQVAAMAEQLAALRDAGLDVTRALAALRTMPVVGPAAGGAAGLMLAGDFSPRAPIDLIAKDLRYAIASAAQPMPMVAAAALRYEAASRAGFGGEDIVAVSRLHR